MRALWKGLIELGGEEIPVKLYAAVQPHAQLSFTLLHKQEIDSSRLRILRASLNRRRTLGAKTLAGKNA